MNLRTAVLLLSLAASMVAIVLIKQAHAQDVAAQEPTARGVNAPVVVELFTSEGCSSCPPADQLLTKLEVEQPITNVEVIALEEHVDYWNNGGWIDPFSSSTATMRQYAYAGALGNGNAYTPQMVVDGQSEFIGSRTGQARNVIQQAGSKKKTEVTLTAAERGNVDAGGKGDKFFLSVGTIPNLSNGDTPEIWMAITETGLHSNVRGGENSGKDLRHASVVRKMRKIGVANLSGSTSYSGEERVKLERDWKPENTRVVIFVQEKKSKKILGAASAKLLD
jgi:hypothetical protein